jgi:hypothetical protein
MDGTVMGSNANSYGTARVAQPPSAVVRKSLLGWNISLEHLAKLFDLLCCECSFWKYEKHDWRSKKHEN